MNEKIMIPLKDIKADPLAQPRAERVEKGFESVLSDAGVASGADITEEDEAVHALLLGKVELDHDLAEVIVGVGIFRVALQRLLEVRRRLCEIPLNGEDLAEIVVGIGVSRIEAKRLLKLHGGLRHLSLNGQRAAEIVVSVRILRPDAQDLLKVADRFFRLAQ